MIIGAYVYDNGGNNDAGKAYLYYGGNPAGGGQISLPRQYEADGITVIPNGGQAVSSTVVLKAKIVNPGGGGAQNVRLEVEVKPLSQAFDGLNSVLGPFHVSGNVAFANIYNLADNTKYKWRARAVFPTTYKGGQYSRWLKYDPRDPARPETIPDFTTGDTTTPDTVITSSPPNPSPLDSASFQFSATESGCSFESRLDAGSWTSTTSPEALSALSEGSHTYEVRATDGAAHTDPTPASYTWTIAFIGPDTTITSQPPSPTNSTDATFSFSADQAGCSFESRLDGGAWGNATSPQSFSNLLEGSQTFEVRATNTVLETDPTPASYIWDIDLTSPETTITSMPEDESGSHDATFAFSANEANSTFEVRLDGGSWTACSAGAVTYFNLRRGFHSFEARATDPAGNTDTTPAGYSWFASVDQKGCGMLGLEAILVAFFIAWLRRKEFLSRIFKNTKCFFPLLLGLAVLISTPAVFAQDDSPEKKDLEEASGQGSPAETERKEQAEKKADGQEGKAPEDTPKPILPDYDGEPIPDIEAPPPWKTWSPDQLAGILRKHRKFSVSSSLSTLMPVANGAGAGEYNENVSWGVGGKLAFEYLLLPVAAVGVRLHFGSFAWEREYPKWGKEYSGSASLLEMQVFARFMYSLENAPRNFMDFKKCKPLVGITPFLSIGFGFARFSGYWVREHTTPLCLSLEAGAEYRWKSVGVWLSLGLAYSGFSELGEEIYPTIEPLLTFPLAAGVRYMF